jgi:uncharacterized delta-60 repeat protein
MAKNLIEFNAYTADIVPYSSYDSTKTTLGPDIFRFSGSTPVEYYIGPNETTFRDITQDTGLSNWGDIDAITYSGDKQWLFCLKGLNTVNLSTTQDIVLYEFDKSNYSYTYVGECRVSMPDVGSTTSKNNINVFLDYYSTGTVEVNGTSVSGTGTNWIENRIPIGARIGFGSTNPDDITTWYRITDYPLMNSTPTKANGAVNCITVDPVTGKIYIGGAFTSWDGTAINRIARLNVDGTLDTSFNVGAGFNGVVNVIVLDSSGKLYVGGAFTSYDGVTANRIIKLNDDGTKDTSFDNTTGFNNTVNEITLDSTGKLYVGGTFTTYKGATENRIIKLNTDGTKDTTFVNTTGFDAQVNTIAVDNNDDIWVGGNFTNWKGTTNNARTIVKLLQNGDRDATFNQGPNTTSGGFNGAVNAIHYKSSTNTVVVGGVFTTWKTVTNTSLTELSATGDAIISSASPVLVYGLTPDSLGNLYCYAGNQLVTKRNVNTLVTDPNFQPNLIFATNTAGLSDTAMGVNLTGDRLYVCSNNTTVDSGIVCVETTGGTRDSNFITTQDYKSQSITINSSAGTLPPGTPYVIEDLKLITNDVSLASHIIQGLSKDDFTPTFTTIPQVATNFMGLSKGAYRIRVSSFNSLNPVSGFATWGNGSYPKGVYLDKVNPTTYYLYSAFSNGQVARLNLKNPYITILGAGGSGGERSINFVGLDQYTVTGVGVDQNGGGAIGGSATLKWAFATMQTGPSAGIKSIYTDSSGVVQLDLNTIENSIPTRWNRMPEVPPGSTTTYPGIGNNGNIYFSPEIDKLIILNYLAAGTSVNKSFITSFKPNQQFPTLSGTLYGRDTFNKLALDNSYDLSFLVNGQQLQGNTANANAPRYPDTLGTGFYGTVENGVLHLCRPLNTIQNNLYAVPIECEAEYVDFSNNAFITPKFNLPNVINISGVYINSQKEYGTFPFNIPPEPIIIDYRTEGIDDNSGEWKRFTDITELNKEIICDGTLNNVTIQFRFSYKVAGNTCLTNKIYGFSLIYEDDRTDSNYTPSVTKSNLNNRIFAWRQDKPWFGNIPDLKIRLYNATNNNIVYYDTVSTSASGTWQYSTDGNTWLAWDSTADNVGNYIRYVADFIPNGIKLRVGLNRI